MSYGVEIYEPTGNLFTREDKTQWRVVGTTSFTIPQNATSVNHTINMSDYDPDASRIVIQPMAVGSLSTWFLINNKKALPLVITYSGGIATITSSITSAQSIHYSYAISIFVLILRRV